ncbi:MAG: cytochrome c [Pirellulaceae bacterium]|nr:cytochrome c [Pirellulaceae bacterium]
MNRCLILMAAPLILAGCSWNSGPPAADHPAPATTDRSAAEHAAPEKLAAQHLPNPVRVHAKVISGGLPDGDAAFAELRQLGVKTIISVDGAKPDVATATKYGLRYVHLPHGYDGVPTQRVRELAKAVRDLEGPIYIHCHHGKHRSPAAASVACVAAGMLPASDAVAVLKVAGTSPNYRGLYRSAEQTQPLEAALLDQLSVDFRESVEIPPMAEAMVALEHTHDHVQEIAAAGWRTPPAHPDLDPAHEALLLREHFTELLRAEYVQREPAEFQELLGLSEQAAQELEDGLRTWQSASAQTQPPASLGQSMDRITAMCKACHEKYRDVPLGEK